MTGSRNRSRCCAAGLMVWAGVVLVGCSTPSKTGPATAATKEQPAPSSQAAAADSQLPAQERVLIAVSKAVRTAKLTDRADECLAYGFDDKTESSAYMVDVRENHSRVSCGGDPQTQPRLFTVRVDRKTDAMTTDAGTPGQFHPLPGAGGKSAQ